MPRAGISGIYKDKNGSWHVDKVYKGIRLRECFGENREEAESWLIYMLEGIRQARLFGVARKFTFDEAAAKYVEDNVNKISLPNEVSLLKSLMPFLRHLSLEEIHDETLKPFIRMREGQGISQKTIHLALTVVKNILKLASDTWRDVATNKPWLNKLPSLTMPSLEGNQRPPMPISRDEQKTLLTKLPFHLRRMAEFILQTGIRSIVACNLQWAWERKIPGLGISVFKVPKKFVKGQKKVGYVVCNSIAQSLIESARGMHPKYVFVYEKNKEKSIFQPIRKINNSGWRRARAAANLGDLHVHDLRHTVGSRLREAKVQEITIADILWHNRKGMTEHYTDAQIIELYEALETLTKPIYKQNISLSEISRTLV